MQIAEAVKTLDGQSQGDQQPSEQQAVRVMMADTLQAMTILGVVKALVLDLPATLAN